VEIVPAESVGISSEQLAKLKAHLQQMVDDQQTGGIQAMIARRGQVVMHENFG